MKMTIEGAIACLSDEQRCKYCLYESENCRQEAIGIAVRSMKTLRERLEGEGRMSENDYIAEYIKEKYPKILGMDFALWRLGKQLSNAVKGFIDALNGIEKEEEKEEKEEVENEQQTIGNRI